MESRQLVRSWVEASDRADVDAPANFYAEDRSLSDLIRLVLETALERLASLLTSLRRFALPLHRWLLVVLAPLHLLIEAVLQHLFLELLEGGFDLVVDDDDFHLARSQMPCGAAIRVGNRVVDPVHVRQSLRPLLDGAGDRRESLP